MTLAKSKPFQITKKFASIIFAITLIAVAVNMFLGPHNIAAGGLTGLAIIFEQWLGVSRETVIYIGNGVLIIVVLFTLGREVFFNTIVGAGLLPVAIGLIPRHTLVADTMLSMIIGSVLFGVAVNILYANNASSGGTAIPPLILHKYFKINKALGLFIADGIIVLLTLIVFDVDSFFFAILSIFITSITMTYLENGLNKKKMIQIISKQSDAIKNDILEKLQRGVTIVPVIGAYRQTHKNMLMVTIAKKDYRKLKQIVENHDPQAFMITNMVSDVHGKGFSYDSGTV
ncbi:MAG: YitT family protein [Defluviitaleaceae bacterium]|nr:YitT family protein [Defluviitaleaceae bacterium]